MRPLSVRIYAASTLLLALFLAAQLSTLYPVHAWTPVLVLMVLTSVTENFAFDLPVNGSVSLSFALIYAALLHSGPLAAVLCALAASVTLRELRACISWPARVFNVGQLALSAGVAGVIYMFAGGNTAFGSPAPAVNLAAALLAAMTFYVVNVLLVTLFIAMLTQQSLPTVLRSQGFLSYAASLVVLALLGLMIAVLLSKGSWLGLLLLVLPFMTARRMFRVYAELSEAFTSTVRSLVTAIEAKDPYTRGHSERVAVYARMLAERLQLTRSDCDLLERAALLHDVGKIGIDLDTLTSPAQLSAEEVRVIRQHPVIGSQLVGDVEFLSQMVPIVRHHHERVDGTGYPDGLTGSSIPFLARLLAVADAYDAMTSDRAYRLGMSRESALEEIRRVSGTQLDEAAATQFMQMLLDETVESP